MEILAVTEPPLTFSLWGVKEVFHFDQGVFGLCAYSEGRGAKSGVQADKIFRIWGERQVFAGSFVFWRGIERKSSTVHRGPSVRKFVMCESKLRVISCQPAIRQQCGCNELSVRGKMGYF